MWLLIIGVVMFTIYLFLDFYWKEAVGGKVINDNRDMVEGILFTLLGHLVVGIAVGLFYMRKGHNNFQNTVQASLIFTFLSQLLYVIPGTIVAQGKQRYGIIKGILLTAGLTFLLTVLSCAGTCLSL